MQKLQFFRFEPSMSGAENVNRVLESFAQSLYKERREIVSVSQTQTQNNMAVTVCITILHQSKDASV